MPRPLTPIPEEDREFSGFLPSRTLILNRQPRFPSVYHGSRVSRSGVNQGTTTGNSWSHSPERDPSPLSRRFLEQHAMPSSLDQRVPNSTSGRMLPLLRALGLSGEQSPSEETQRQTGNQFGPPPSPEIWHRSPPMYVLRVIGPYSQLEPIMSQFRQWSEDALSSGGELELVSRVEPGKRPEWTLTAKIHEPSSGVVTIVKQMLCLMNFEVVSTLPIYSDGWIDIQYVWKSKEEVGR